MADLSAVETAMVGICAAALFYPSSYAPGAYQASTPAGCTVKLYRGWPEAANLDADLNAGRAHVSVFSDKGASRVTDVPHLDWQTVAGTVTLTSSTSGRVVTFGGTGGAGQAVAVLLGDLPAASWATYQLGASDTPATTAAGLAAQISGASASGAALTLPGHAPIMVRIGANGTGTLQTRRQMQMVRVSCWCPTPAIRDAIASTIDAAFANLQNTAGQYTRFIMLSDGTSALVRYASTNSDDKPARDRVWRRDLCYSAEYATAVVATQPPMLLGDLILNSGSFAA